MKLILENIKKNYGAFTLNADLELNHGEFHTFLGPSGCGKTTLLRIIAGFTAPDSGHIYLDGKDITEVPPEKRNISIVFQDYALFPNMTVARNIGYGPETRHWSRERIKARTEELLEAVELPGYGNRKPDTLSGGEKQRVALARAIAVNPELLLLDEPLSAADEKL
ncbi:MAG: ATP-binding cassette domain-containing protein, partial [Spirochaetia bacterium]|nr:ATP-binding cassette domain-containing protein [Spirochaetia bacterium]